MGATTRRNRGHKPALLRFVTLSAMAIGLTACSWFRGAAQAPEKLADRMRLSPVPYAKLVSSAQEGPARNVLWVRETNLAGLMLGENPESVRRRHGEPTRVRRTAEGTWWDYDEVYKKPGATPTPTPMGKALEPPPDERETFDTGNVGMNLRLLFVAAPVLPAPPALAAVAPSPAPSAAPVPQPASDEGTAIILSPAPTAPAPTARVADNPLAALAALIPSPVAVATPAPAPTPTLQLAHIQAWAPARFQTRSLVGILDAAARIERKYSKAPRTLPWGGDGGEVWLYPAANVAFVVTPAWETQPRYVAGTLVGFPTTPQSPAPAPSAPASR